MTGQQCYCHVMKRLVMTILLIWLVFVALPSVPKIRSILAKPLVVTNESASGDACYVLSAGYAIWERLAAASDLYHMKRISRIIMMQNNKRGPYSFNARESWSATQWEVHCLVWRGVPEEKVLLVDEDKGMFGTESEASTVARSLPSDVRRLVLVTSAPHTRRSLLAFRRVLPAGIEVTVYAATPFETSAEFYNPIWLEYLKLLFYSLFLYN
jgi:uncharacterized SAM-binding protein YcdF (DUF218 family)